MSLPSPLSDLVLYCENLCVKECCGIESFDFSPIHLASWLQQSRGEPSEEVLQKLHQQLEDFRTRFGSGSSSEGYESDDSEMNQIFSPEQVDQLAQQLAANLKVAVQLKDESNLAQWKPEGAPSSDSHQPSLGNTFVRALSWRYATKKFDPKSSISEQDIETLLSAINLSASSYGLQPYQFLVIQDKSLQEKLVPCSYGQQQVADAAAVLVFAIRTDVDEAYIRQSATETEQIRGLEPGQLDDYAKQMIGSIMGFSEHERANWASKQAYIAMGTALAACAMLGIDSCPMEGFVADKYDEILSLPEKNLRSVLVLPIGQRADNDENSVFAKVRKTMDQIVVRI